VPKFFCFPLSFSPAGFWRAFLCALLLAFVSVSGGVARADVAEAEVLELEGAEILRELRSVELEGDIHLRFELKVLPRRGRARVFSGELWGSRNTEGPVSRVVLYDDAAEVVTREQAKAATRAQAEAVEGGVGVSSAQRPVRTLLIQNGVAPQVWVYEAGMAAAERLPERDWHAPLLADAEISAFDLLMPYLYWEDFDFEGGDKVLGRAAHRFLFRAPSRAEESEGTEEPSGRVAVRAYFDQQFHALLQSKLIGADGAVAKTLTVRDLQKISGQWMLKSIDLRNERTRDKTRFEVQEAELGLELSTRIFTPDSLGKTVGLSE